MIDPDSVYQPISEQPRSLGRKALSISISILVHLLFFVGLFLVYEPLKVQIYQEVRNVIIASPIDIVFPEYRPPTETAQSSSREVAETAEQPRSGVKPSSGEAVRERIIDSQAGAEFDTAISTRFQLQPSGPEKLRLSSGYQLELSLRPEEARLFTPQITDPESGSRVDISSFINSDLSGGKLPSYSGTPGLGGRSWLQVQMDELQQDFDLSPWSEKVVGIVLANWTVPPSSQYTLSGRVEITAFIQKDGRVSEGAILVSSQNSLIDQTALKALESSILPGLPEGYPREKIQIKFVFALR